MAIEVDPVDAQELLKKSAVTCPKERPASIACYNGSRSFTLAGSTKAVIAVETCATALEIPQSNIIPLDERVHRVRHFPGSVEKDNPAYKAVEFLDSNFLRMSCGGLLLDTTRAKAHSSTLAAVGLVSDEVALGYIQYWKKVDFLSA